MITIQIIKEVVYSTAEKNVQNFIEFIRKETTIK